jgi:hypothetical protein
MKEPLNIVKMKMWRVRIDESEYVVGNKEKEFMEKVFGSYATYEEIDLRSESDSSTIEGDE